MHKLMKRKKKKRKKKIFNQKLTNILTLLDKKVEIQNFVILLLKVGHLFNKDWN